MIQAQPAIEGKLHNNYKEDSKVVILNLLPVSEKSYTHVMIVSERL